MATFNKIISAIQVFLLVACSAEQGNSLRGGSSSRSGNPTYYSADNDEDFAEVPTPVAGAFQLLDCDYEQPSIRDKAVDIGCSVKNDQGELVREFMKDTDSINMYKNMRETLVYLTHLDCQDTERIMTEKLTKQVGFLKCCVVVKGVFGLKKC